MKLKHALLGSLLLVGANAMACYTVYDANNRIVYQGADAPVDMSLPLHQALGQRFARGAQMVFDQHAACTPVNIAQVARPTSGDVPPNTIRMERSSPPGSSSSPSPLFTDRATAQRANLPHTQVAGNIVMVPPAAADRAMRPAVTVIPSTAFAAASTAPDTRAMGAAPARVNGAAAAAGATGATVISPRKQVVITEYRDPPMTVIEGGGGVTISR